VTNLGEMMIEFRDFMTSLSGLFHGVVGLLGILRESIKFIWVWKKIPIVPWELTKEKDFEYIPSNNPCFSNYKLTKNYY
jgi:hypothetical protein